MEALKECSQKLAEEKQVQAQINQAIEQCQHFVFDAGAGSGKTYALVESLNYIVKEYGQTLRVKNQHILCITYTNAAAKNIKDNLGNNDSVKVSTIHERIWELIKLHQDELLIEHKAKIFMTLSELKSKFNESDAFNWFTSQSTNNQNRFKEHFMQSEVKEQYYQLSSARDIEDEFENKLNEFDYLLKRNVGKFKPTLKYLYQVEKLNKCLALIEQGINKEVKYNANFNSDRLHYMTISHDTLLEYALSICSKYQRFRKIVVDSFPYILIDEYQDTNPNVVKVMSLLAKESRGTKQLCIGYFGDRMQSIYSDGVGCGLHEIHNQLLTIAKLFNRRSRDQIIDIANKFRNDGILQESIYQDNKNGTFNFYQLNGARPNDSSILVNQFINNEPSLANSKEVHCLVLKNEMLAELCGFKPLYDNLKKFFFYNEQAQKLISSDVTKLDPAVRIIYSLMDFRYLISRQTKSLSDVLPNENMTITMQDAKNYVTELNSLLSEEIISFRSFLTKIFNLYETGSCIFKTKLKEILPVSENQFSLLQFQHVINTELSNGSSIEEDDRLSHIEKAFDLDLIEFIRWYGFISDSSMDKVKYHTYHSTKGLEYENVLIIMENSFSKQKNYFPDFFRSADNPDYQDRRNLLYVACSRAISHLKVLYLDPTRDFSDEINVFFGAPTNFSVKES